MPAGLRRENFNIRAIAKLTHDGAPEQSEKVAAEPVSVRRGLQRAIQDHSRVGISHSTVQPVASYKNAADEATIPPAAVAEQPSAPVPSPVERAPIPTKGVIALKHPAAVGQLKEAFKRLLADVTKRGGSAESQSDPHAFNLEDPELHPAVLDSMFTAMFGVDWWGWEHETLNQVLDEIAGMGTQISDENRDKLQAVSALHVTNYPWMEYHVFEKTATALNGATPDFDHFEDLSPGMILVAVRIMRMIQPDHNFSHDVLRYIAARCVEHGLLIFPDQQIGDSVNTVIQRLSSRSVSERDYEGMRAVWDDFISKNGVDLDPQVIDGLSEDHVADVQIVRGYTAVRYAQEFDERMQGQLNSLAAWAKSVVKGT